MDINIIAVIASTAWTLLRGVKVEKTSSIKDNFLNIVKEKTVRELLDQYDECFVEYYKEDILRDNVDMDSLFKNRLSIIHILQIDLLNGIQADGKQKFIDEICQMLKDSSPLVKTYLNGFYDLISIKENDDVNRYISDYYGLEKVTAEINRIERRVKELEFAPNTINNTKRINFDYERYYRYIEKKFTHKKRGETKNLVGDYSDEESYIDTHIIVNNISVSVLSYLQEWFNRNTSGTLLIYGDPGYGKSMLCNKAIVEFMRGNFLRNVAKSVLSISLNTGINRTIIQDGKVNLENALVCMDFRNTFSFEDCQDALLFMDGFDEFIDEAKRTTNIQDIITFIKLIDIISEKYNIHIVILSRTAAIEKHLTAESLLNKSFEMAPITNNQQEAWIKQHIEYDDYYETFVRLRGNTYLKSLFGNPLLFRMIVHSRFDELSSNIVELYDMLFTYLLHKRNIRGEEFEFVLKEFTNLAYDIYCNDEDTAVIPKEEWHVRGLIVFYIKQFEGGRIGFLHRTFYYYFLAKYIYLLFINLTDNNAEYCIGLLAERELNDTVCQYLSLMINDRDKDRLYVNMEKAINTLIKTEAYLNLYPKYSFGDAEKTKLGRSENIYRNLLRICAAFSFVIRTFNKDGAQIKDGLSFFIRRFKSDYISLCSDVENRIDLSESNLVGANLVGSNLKRANLRKSNMSKSQLSEIDLSGAVLSEIILFGADLKRANLKGSYLRGANLIGADLDGADLSGADLRDATLTRTILTEANLDGANLSGAILNGANLSGAVLTNVNLIQGNLNTANLIGTDMRESDLRETNLKGANLTRANLWKSNLCDAVMTNSSISWGDLRRANLAGADLREANLINVDLRETNLTKTILINANLTNAKMKGSILSGAVLTDAILIGTDIDFEKKRIYFIK